MFKHLLSKQIFLLLPFLLLFSCSPKMEVGNVNLDNWKSDRNGCKGLRIQDLEEFRRVKNSILGKDNQTLIKTFGRPDKVELIDRSQSFFFYFLEPGPLCDPVHQTDSTQPLKVLIRLNAVSKVSEVTISHLDP
jgi:hypothetical protein